MNEARVIRVSRFLHSAEIMFMRDCDFLDCCGDKGAIPEKSAKVCQTYHSFPLAELSHNEYITESTDAFWQAFQVTPGKYDKICRSVTL